MAVKKSSQPKHEFWPEAPSQVLLLDKHRRASVEVEEERLATGAVRAQVGTCRPILQPRLPLSEIRPLLQGNLAQHSCSYYQPWTGDLYSLTSHHLCTDARL